MSCIQNNLHFDKPENGECIIIEQRILIRNIPKISAIYFAMLQCGYEYYNLEKDDSLVKTIEAFIAVKNSIDLSFFSKIKQNTCEVYPYWPRAALLETASFFTNHDSTQFRHFDTYKNNIMSAGNISCVERNQSFWDWVKDFPAVLASVINSDSFQSYLNWESQWIQQQNRIEKNNLDTLQQILDVFVQNYASPIQKISVILNPIKCAYASDYHMEGNQFFFISGMFKPDYVIHEFLHHIVHPYVVKSRNAILQCNVRYPGIVESYYLSGDEDGRLNAFEEYMVRCLTQRVMDKDFPENLCLFIEELLYS